MPFCRFCFDNKINGPHNHFLRESKNPSSRLTCPLLLNTQCLKCNKKGHTVNYCRVKVGEIKNFKEIDEDGFITIKGKNQKTKNHDKVFMENKNSFTILCENSGVDEKSSKTEKKLNQFSKRPLGMSWADWEEMDN